MAVKVTTPTKQLMTKATTWLLTPAAQTLIHNTQKGLDIAKYLSLIAKPLI